MQFQTLETQVDDGILIIQLDRRDRLNAFTPQMAAELETLFHGVNEDDAVRAIVVTGQGRAFCAGMDLSVEGNVFGLDESLRPTLDDLQKRFDDPEIVHGVRDTGGRVALAIHQCLKPVIAAINGVAVGVGATMTLAMDFRLVAENAKIGFVFGKLGIVPEACSTYFLPRLVGEQRALEWMLGADLIDATTAFEAGLVRSIHQAEELLPAAIDLAHRLTDDRSPVAVALTRQMIRRNAELDDPAEAHRIESLAMFYTSIGDGKEGIAAFREKRPPKFTAKSSRMPAFYPW